LAAPISSFGPHFDLVQSCALAVSIVADNAATQHNTSVLRIDSPPDVFVDVWLRYGFALASRSS